MPNHVNIVLCIWLFSFGVCFLFFVFFFSHRLGIRVNSLHTQLVHLALDSNGLCGSIPSWIYRLMNLETLDLYFNYFGGIVKFDNFLKLQNLKWLQLSSNQISLLTKPSNNITFPKFRILARTGILWLRWVPIFFKKPR